MTDEAVPAGRRGSRMENGGWTKATGRWLTTALLLAGLSGCANRERIPVYPAMADEAALRTLAQRAAAIHDASGSGSLTLTRPGGDSVRMDVAVVMQRPGRVRMRAWKFSRAVFDLTVNEDGVFLVAPSEAGGGAGEKVRSAGIGAGKFARAIGVLFGGDFFTRAGLRVLKDSPFTLEVDISGERVTCEVDRRTLTPRVYRVLDERGNQRFKLELSKYVDHGGGIVYPHAMVATSEQGKAEVALRDVDINAGVAAGAFKPPARAEKLP